MFIDKNSIQVKTPNMNDFISLGTYLVEAKYGFNKLFGNDSGRNLAGVMTASLIGIFVKLTLEFGRLTKTQLETLVPILDSPTQLVKYYDPNKKATVTMETYTGDYEISNKGIVNGNRKNEGFSCSFIAVRKRS